jgi:hypothetical protein
MNVATAHPVADVAAARVRHDDLLWKWLPFVLILTIAVAERHVVIGNADVSWLITASEKILDGRRLYIDVVELNPPASVFLYLPAVAIARAVGLAPEIVVDAMVFIGALASLTVVSAIVRRCRLLDGARGWTMAAFALAILTILPAQTFGQREHIALIAVLPAIATLAARATGAKPLFWHGLLAGLGAGMAICIKPHFALAIGLAAAMAALQQRSWRVLLVVENFSAAVVAAVYAAVVIIFYRAYITDVMPILADVYLPVRLPLWKLLIGEPMVLWAAAVLVVVVLRRGAGRQPAFPVLLMASVGFAAAFVIQGKGWPYHAYPMLALVLIALALAATDRRRTAEPEGGLTVVHRLGAVLALCILTASSFVCLNLAVDTRAAIAVVKRLAPPHPSIVAISADIAIGHPLVRAVEGRWISGFWGLWITGNAATRRLAGGLDAPTRQRLAVYVSAERRRLIGEIKNGRPDIILIDNRGPRWSEGVDGDPELSALIAANYGEIGTADDIAILKRKGM